MLYPGAIHVCISWHGPFTGSSLRDPSTLPIFKRKEDDYGGLRYCAALPPTYTVYYYMYYSEKAFPTRNPLARNNDRNHVNDDYM